jgi:hypothetical protein
MKNAVDLSTFPNEMITEVRGRMGGLVYYMRNGRIRVRKHVIPANPRTRSQQGGRTRFATAVRRWRALDDCAREPWNRRARQMNMSGYNLFISREMNRRRRLKRCAGRRWYRTGPVLLRQAQYIDRRGGRRRTREVFYVNK